MVRALDDGSIDGGAEQRLKVPPNSIEAEQALVGGLMLNAQAWDKVADVISADDFYRKDHRLIFQAIDRLIDAPATSSPCPNISTTVGNSSRPAASLILRRWPTRQPAPPTLAPTRKSSGNAQCCAP